MSEKTIKNLKKWFAVFLGVWTVLIGLAFIVQVWRIYTTDGGAYTTERIAKMFSQIAVPVYVWLAAIVAGGVVWLVFPEPKKQPLPYIELKDTLSRLQRRLPASQDAALAQKYRTQRLAVRCACAAVGLVCAVVAVLYLVCDYKLIATDGFFAKHEEAERILRSLVWVVGALGVGIFAAYFTERSYKKQLALVKTAMAQNAKDGIKTEKREENPTFSQKIYAKLPFLRSNRFLLIVRLAIAAVAVLFIVLGMDNGGMAAVLDKAINICSQCIGIG